MGTVLIGRWYWWRVNAWSEISALLGTAGMLWALHTDKVSQWMTEVSVSFNLLKGGEENPDLFAPRVVIVTIFVTSLWVMVTLLTSEREPSAKTTAFYLKLRVGGPGWAVVARRAGVTPVRGELTTALLAWIVSMVWLYSLLLGIGKLVLQEWKPGFILLAVGLLTSEILRRLLLNQNVMGTPVAPATKP